MKVETIALSTAFMAEKASNARSQPQQYQSGPSFRERQVMAGDPKWPSQEDAGLLRGSVGVVAGNDPLDCSSRRLTSCRKQGRRQYAETNGSDQEHKRTPPFPLFRHRTSSFGNHSRPRLADIEGPSTLALEAQWLGLPEHPNHPFVSARRGMLDLSAPKSLTEIESCWEPATGCRSTPRGHSQYGSCRTRHEHHGVRTLLGGKYESLNS